jgi:hypothetical protein
MTSRKEVILKRGSIVEEIRHYQRSWKESVLKIPPESLS